MNDNCLEKGGPKKVCAICRLIFLILTHSRLSFFLMDCFNRLFILLLDGAGPW